MKSPNPQNPHRELPTQTRSVSPIATSATICMTQVYVYALHVITDGERMMPTGDLLMCYAHVTCKSENNVGLNGNFHVLITYTLRDLDKGNVCSRTCVLVFDTLKPEDVYPYFPLCNSRACVLKPEDIYPYFPLCLFTRLRACC